MHPAPGFAELLPALLQRLREQLPELRGTWLFGSQAHGTAGPHSDVDLAVLGPTTFDPVRIFDLGLELGVLARRDVDLIDVRRAPTVLKKEILAEGKLIDCLDRAACETFTADSMALYVAFREELALAGRSLEDRR